MNLADPLLAFRWRLAETIAWCDRRGSLVNHVYSLRSPALQPASMTDEFTTQYGYDWGDKDDKQATIRHLSETRTYLLRQAGDYPVAPAQNAGNGRLLVNCAPEESDSCCLSEAETHGFIDDADLPPWDTWLWYAEESATHDPNAVRQAQEAYRHWWNDTFMPPDSVRYWLCWIPAPFVSLVDKGIAVNPVECFWWASEYQKRLYGTPFLRLLNAEGFLK